MLGSHFIFPEFASRLKVDDDLIGSYNKVFIVGEFGLVPTRTVQSLLEPLVYHTTATCGALLWSLRFHSKDGGFCRFLLYYMCSIYVYTLYK